MDVSNMTQKNDSFLQYREQGFTTVSNALLANYNNLKLSNQQLILILQLERYAQRNEFFPANELLASQTNFSVSEVGLILQSLIDQGFLVIEQGNDASGRINDAYTLAPLYVKLTEFLDQNVYVHSQTREAASPVAQPQESKLDQTIRQFEIEFGRMISPIERQMIQSWFTVDHYDAGVIQLALREAVLAQVYNFKYVDRILLNWQRMNLKTTLQVERYLQQ